MPRHIKHIFILAICIVSSSLSTFAQSGGENTFLFLDLSPTAQMSGLGGQQTGLLSDNISTSFYNPVQVNRDFNQGVAVNYSSYVGDVSYGLASYGKKLENIGILSAGIHFVNYGEFTETDPEGHELGTFSAAEYVGFVGLSKSLSDRFQLGVTLKPIYSKLEKYSAFAIVTDLGAMYESKNERTSAGLVLKNIGTQISTYYDGAEKQDIPFSLDLGVSHRLEHAPLRLLGTLHHLNRWDLYSEIDENESSFSKEFLAHLNVGIELIPSEKFNLRVGYNQKRRNDLKLTDASGMSGFSFGAGIKLKRLTIDYSLANYHIGASSHQFAISIPFD